MQGNDPDPIFSNPLLAQIYDAFDSDRSDLAPYVDILKDFKAHRIIDLGCGTGVLALLLAKEGMSVKGIDPAEASVHVAQSKPRAEMIEWLVGDANALAHSTADAVLMTGNVAQAITGDKDWANTLTQCRDALVPNGHLVFETRNPEYQAWKEWDRERSFKSIEISDIGTVDAWVELIKVGLPLVSFRWTYYFRGSNQTITSDSTLRFRTTEELTRNLTECGFIVEDIREAPDRPNKELVAIARVS